MNHTGGCLCGAVRYKVEGKPRDVLECHCTMCRKTHGHVAAYTAVPKAALEMTDATGLRWYVSSDKARRGFCGTCGSSLFWDPTGKDYIAVAAGTLDAPTGLKTVLQIHTADAGDYYAVRPDVPGRPHGSAGG
jgi:hypothetical protein